MALRVNDGISSRMIIEASDAQYLQKHGDMIYRNSDTLERFRFQLVSQISKLINDHHNRLKFLFGFFVVLYVSCLRCLLRC